MKRTRIIALLTLAMFLLTLLPAAAFAGGQDKVTAKANLEFKDADSAKWASKQISKLKAKDIIAGYSDGTFQPNKPVTRAEAVAMVLKATAGEVNQVVYDSVYSTVYLPFKDAKSIPKWAQGFISIAQEKGYLSEEKSGSFQPNKPATRLWVAKLLVRALKLDTSALANVQLTFNDASAIPADAVPFITAAVENGLLKGYPDGTFKPNKPVTRAEMAALLGLADTETPLPEVRKHKIEGVVVSVQKATTTTAVYDGVYETTETTTITIKKADGEEATYPVSDDVKVFIEDKAAALADVTAGLRVELVLNKAKTVVYIASVDETYRGKLTVYDAAYGTVTIRIDDVEKTFTLADDVQVFVNDKPVDKTVLVAGLKVWVKVVDDKIAVIKAVVHKKKGQNGGNPDKKAAAEKKNKQG